MTTLPSLLFAVLCGTMQESETPPVADPATAPAVTETAPAPADEPVAEVLQPMDRLLPATTLVHVELADCTEMLPRLQQTAVWKLIQEEEVQTFITPMFEHFWRDIEVMIFESPDAPDLTDEDAERVRAMLANPAIGRISASLLAVDDEGEPTATLSIESAPHAAHAFDMIVRAALEDETAEVEEIEVAGRRVMRDTKVEEGSIYGELILDGSRLMLVVAPALPAEGTLVAAMFDEQAEHLADAGWYQEACAGLGLQDPLLRAVVDVASAWKLGKERLREALDMANFDFDLEDRSPEQLEREKKEAELAKRLSESSPMMNALRSAAMGWELRGEEVVERWTISAPGDRSAWSAGGSFTGIAEDHAALADAGSDLFVTAFYDLKRTLEIAEADRARSVKMAKEVGLDEDALPADLIKMLTDLEERTGFDLRGRLIPTLGMRASFWLDMPSGFGATIPDAGIIVDVADAAAFDALVDELIAADEKLEEVSFTVSENKGHRLVSVNLLNAGLPVIPTLARVGDHLMITLSPQSMKSAILNQQRGKHLGASERIAALRAYAGEDSHTMLGWVDIPSIFGFVYTAASGLLGALGSQATTDFPFEVDFNLLPSAQTLLQHLRPGVMSLSEDAQGFTVDGQSVVGIPPSGLITGATALIFTVGAAAGLHDGVEGVHRQQTEERLLELAQSMRAYRDSVGGGQWPSSVVELVDRGILVDAGKLVDPVDPRPRRVRSGSGERLPVSFTVMSAESLPDPERRQLPEGCDKVLATRGAWYKDWRGPIRLVVGLGFDDPQVLAVAEEDAGD